MTKLEGAALRKPVFFLFSFFCVLFVDDLKFVFVKKGGRNLLIRAGKRRRFRRKGSYDTNRYLFVVLFSLLGRSISY